MESNINDDARKKRDSTAVVTGGCVVVNKENTKKLRAAKTPSVDAGATAAQLLLSSTAPVTNEASEKAACPAPSSLDDTSGAECSACHSDTEGAAAPGRQQALNLEVALRRIVRMGDKDDSKEFLSQNRWVNFRTGHAGDASSLAASYQKSKSKYGTSQSSPNDDTGTGTCSTEDTSLEVKLAEGLGDEDTPPSIFALLAEIDEASGDGSGDRTLGAAAIVSIAWEDISKVLRVEWFYVSDDNNFADVVDLLERRMWLRLSALAMMTSCQLLLVNGVAAKKRLATPSLTSYGPASASSSPS